MKNSFSRRKKSSFKRNTILSRLPGNPNSKYFDGLNPILFNNITTLFISRGGAQLACFDENRVLPGMLASFSW